MFRSSNVILETGFTAVQGALCASLIGANPKYGAGCFAGIALTEKVFVCASRKFVSGSEASLGPIPIGLKSMVSYGLATYTTFKIMQLAGLILSVPFEIQVIGAISLTTLVLNGILKIIQKD